MRTCCFLGLLVVFLVATGRTYAGEIHATVVYDDIATGISNAREEGEQLWITTADLKRATRFEVKPQGVCRDELCFPLPKSKQQNFLRKEPGGTWFNMTEFAGLVRQSVAHDAALSVWYFGVRGDQRQMLSSLQAPDFTLPDINGKPHSLRDFHGKKVLLVTWASW